MGKKGEVHLIKLFEKVSTQCIGITKNIAVSKCEPSKYQVSVKVLINKLNK